MTVFTGSRIFDGESATLRVGHQVFVQGDRITEVSARPPNPGDGDVIDCGRAISQTGGHGDFRNPAVYTAHDDELLSCDCGQIGLLTAVADGDRPPTRRCWPTTASGCR